MRSFTSRVLSVLAAIAVCLPGSAQAVTEYGLGAGRAATTTAPARNAASAIAGALENLSKAAGAGSSAASSQSSSSSPEIRRAASRTASRRAETKSAKPTDPPAAPTAAPVYEDPKLIQAGMEYDEMVRRFGPPSMMVTAAPGTSTLWYSSQGSTYQIEVTNGKVTAAPPGGSATTTQ